MTGRVHMHKTTKGLILREVKYKETDRLLTVLTDDMGKLTVKATASLKKTGKAAAATQLFAFSELTMFERMGRWQITEGSVIEEFTGLRSDISALALASYFAECVEALSDEDQPNPMMLQLILNCLYALSNNMYSQEHIKTAFEMRLMCLAGYTPDLSACAVCGNSEPAEPRFSPRNGIICCRDCLKADMEANVRLCGESLNALRYIIEAEPRKILSRKMGETGAERAAYAAEQYLKTQTEKAFSALSYWKQVKL